MKEEHIKLFPPERHTIDLLIRPQHKLTSANPHPIHLIVDWKKWPERSRKMRGWSFESIILRRVVIHPDEALIYDLSYRLQFFKYLCWSNLLEDEAKFISTESDYYQKLHNFSGMSRYNYIPFHKIGEQKTLF